MEYSAVIFDLFGTLAQGFSGPSQTTAQLASTLNVPYEPFMKVWRDTLDMRSDGTFKTLEAALAYGCEKVGVTVGAEEIANAIEIRMAQIRSALMPKPDAVATLTMLKRTGYKIGLLSNCSSEIPVLWPEMPLAGLIDEALFSCIECLKKPARQFFRLACERLAVEPNRCLYVADGENYELNAAAEVGLHPVLIRNPAQETHKELFREAGEWQGPIISTLSEVLPLVGVYQAT